MPYRYSRRQPRHGAAPPVVIVVVGIAAAAWVVVLGAAVAAVIGGTPACRSSAMWTARVAAATGRCTRPDPYA